MEVPRKECSHKHYEAWPESSLGRPHPAWSTSRCLQDPVPSALNSVAPRFAELLLNHCHPGVDSRALPRLTCDPSSFLAESGGSGAGDAGVGGLVQPPTAAGAHRQHATSRGRGPLLSTTYRVSPSGITHTKEHPEKRRRPHLIRLKGRPADFLADIHRLRQGSRPVRLHTLHYELIAHNNNARSSDEPISA